MAVTPTYVPSSFVQQALAGYLAVDGATAVPASAANPLPVTVVSGGSTSQIVVTQYVATAAATGYSVGDIIEHVVELNLTATPATVVASIWVNATQGTVLASAPSSSNIALVAGAVTAQPKYVAPPHGTAPHSMPAHTARYRSGASPPHRQPRRSSSVRTTSTGSRSPPSSAPP